jgi:hypothetical protein
MFLLAAKRGFESSTDQKYFEQLLACENYNYFKNMMTKRNLQLEEQTYKLIQEKMGDDAAAKFQPEFEEMQKKRHEIEMEIAIQMSLALEEERKKLEALEEDELLVRFK